MPPTGLGRKWLGLAAILCGLAASPSSCADEAAVPLPRDVLFEPLLADPRWAHFSAAWHDYGGDDNLDNVAAASLGEDFSFYQDQLGDGRWAVGLQAGVFAIFDLDAASNDLVNADYWVGVPLSWRQGPWQGLVRLFHQSSHLGDEFLLRTRPRRVNLSYEALDLRLSRHMLDGMVRAYGGGGVLLHRIPDDLDRLSLQAGLELRAPHTLANDWVRPVAAVDLKATEEAGWDVDTSVRAGMLVENPKAPDYSILVALEYFGGRNPNGQFYGTRVDYWGLGVHVFF